MRSRVLITTRLISAVFSALASLTLVVMLNLVAKKPEVGTSYAWLLMLPVSVYVLDSIAFGLCAVASWARGVAINDDIRALLSARIGAPLLHTAGTLNAALAIIGGMYIAYLRGSLFESVSGWMAVVLYVAFFSAIILSFLDLILGAKMRFRFAYLWMGPVYFFTVSIIFHIYIHVGIHGVTYFVQPSSWHYENWQLTSFGVVCLSTIFMFSLSRLFCFCARSMYKTDNEIPWGTNSQRTMPGLYKV